ncbi:tetratricopeptide repeat protein [Acidiphilium sp.]|uniref:tetratricopeptide repeat protein n=1 Tax=Acidiphilium sp. TaxID=527 RepID=UPI003D0408D8
MSRLNFPRIAIIPRVAMISVAIAVFQMPAHADIGPTPQQLQSMIAQGHEKAALTELQSVIRAHPQSGVAWFLVAEAQDAEGHRDAARRALAKAENISPGLPFARSDRVAALKAHLTEPPVGSGSRISPVVLVIGGLVGLFLLLRLFARSRRIPSLPTNQGGFGSPGMAAGGSQPFGPFGAGPQPTAMGTSGSGIGGALVSGLAAGAGFAAGERLIDDLTGATRGGRDTEAGPADDPTPVPDRDDGLSNQAGWDDSGSTQADDDTLDNNSDW